MVLWVPYHYYYNYGNAYYGYFTIILLQWIPHMPTPTAIVEPLIKATCDMRTCLIRASPLSPK